MNSHARGDERRLPRFEDQRFIETCPHVHAGRSVGRVIRQWKLLSQPLIEDLQFDDLHPDYSPAVFLAASCSQISSTSVFASSVFGAAAKVF